MTKQPYRQQILYSEDNTTVVDVLFIVSIKTSKRPSIIVLSQSAIGLSSFLLSG
jgi:hypothetical protein